MFIVDVLKNFRHRADQRALLGLVPEMTDGQMDDIGLGGLRAARRQAETRRFAAAAGWGPWRLG